MCISYKPAHTLRGIQTKFKLNNDKMEKPEVYLGAELSSMDNEQGIKCWAMSSDKYCAAMVKNIEDSLKRKGHRLPTKCDLPIRHGYKPEMDSLENSRPKGYSGIKR